jgi:hypothetical protein
LAVDLETYHYLGLIGLLSHDLVELTETVLERLQNMRLELSEAVLHLDQILSIVVLLDDLFVQAVPDASLEHVWIVVRGDFAA